MVGSYESYAYWRRQGVLRDDMTTTDQPGRPGKTTSKSTSMEFGVSGDSTKRSIEKSAEKAAEESNEEPIDELIELPRKPVPPISSESPQPTGNTQLTTTRVHGLDDDISSSCELRKGQPRQQDHIQLLDKELECLPQEEVTEIRAHIKYKSLKRQIAKIDENIGQLDDEITQLSSKRVMLVIDREDTSQEMDSVRTQLNL